MRLIIPSKMFQTSITLGISLLLLLFAWPKSHAWGYDLGYHQDLTRAFYAPFSPGGKGGFMLISNNNLYVDIATNAAIKKTPLMKIIHFDDKHKYSRVASLRRGLYLAVSATTWLKCTRSNLSRYAAIVGTVLHSIQDYYAHTNHTEMVNLYLKSPIRGGYSFKDIIALRKIPGLRMLWLADVPDVLNESLLSGAYFSPPATVTTATGTSLKLTHDALNKDKVSIPGLYAYPLQSRTTNHFLSKKDAMIEMSELLYEFNKANPKCFIRLVSYKSTTGDWLRAKLYKILAKVAGHWRSGNPVIQGDGYSIIVHVPPIYPDRITQKNNYFSYKLIPEEVGVINYIEIPIGKLSAKKIIGPLGWEHTEKSGKIIWSRHVSQKRPSTREIIEFKIIPEKQSIYSLAEIKLDPNGRALLIPAPAFPDQFHKDFMWAIDFIASTAAKRHEKKE